MTTTMNASQALDYALNWAEDLGPIPRLILIYVADSGSIDTDLLVKRTGCSPDDVRRAIATLAADGHLDAIKGRWAA